MLTFRCVCGDSPVIGRDELERTLACSGVRPVSPLKK